MTNITDPDEFERLWHDMDSHKPKTDKCETSFTLSGNVSEQHHICAVCGYMYVCDSDGEIVIDCECGRGR